jgi:hypothetical protein
VIGSPPNLGFLVNSVADPDLGYRAFLTMGYGSGISLIRIPNPSQSLIKIKMFRLK